MKQVNNIFHHYKGVVTELAFVGDHPIESKYMVFMEVKPVDGERNTVNVLRDDLRTPFMYSTNEYDMMVRKQEWIKAEQDKINMWFDNNSK